MKAIVCVDNNWAIGKNNDLLVRIPDDMKRFRAFTTGNVIVMGRKTLESFPGGKPLPDRVNIVLTHNQNFEMKNVVVAHSLDELKEILKDYESKEIYLIGGDSLYKQLVPICDEVLVTKVDFEYDADRYFPNLDNDEEWYVDSESEEQTYYDIIYHYINYRHK
ncbi:MAG: dihydrofolate reductase [Lachnospiraceae bacterium]|nr:dihydrofolate reductase [Lachnospiraceae bacterium]